MSRLLTRGENMGIRTIRLSKNLTQDNLASLVGVARTTVTMWETGAAMPRADKLTELAKILGCTIDDLMKADD